MHECPCCFEQIYEEEAVVPHCGQASHSACATCTRQWYSANTDQPCMVCRIGRPQRIKAQWVLLGFVYTLFTVWMTCTKYYSYHLPMSYLYLLHFYAHSKGNIKPSFGTGSVVAVGCAVLSTFWLTLAVQLLIVHFLFLTTLFVTTLHVVWFLGELLLFVVKDKAVKMIQAILIVSCVYAYIGQCAEFPKAYMHFKLILN